MNLIIISINVDINEKKNKISLKKSSLIKMKNLLTNQLFFKFLMIISVKILSTSDSLTVRISSAAKSVSVILCHFFCRAVRAALKNIDSSVPANLTFQAVRVITLTISSDSQAVRVILLACRSHSQSQKDENVTSIIQQAQKLT